MTLLDYSGTVVLSETMDARAGKSFVSSPMRSTFKNEILKSGLKSNSAKKGNNTITSSKVFKSGTHKKEKP